MDTKNLRFIVFLLNPNTQQYMLNGDRIDTHDGEIFSSLKDAKEYAEDSIKSKQCTRFVIGFFVFGNQSERISISCVETYGFKNDKKDIDKLTLFS